MKKFSDKVNCSAGYSLVQFVTWSYYAVVLAFASNVLYEFGFSDSKISLFLGVFTALSAAVQVLAGELLSRVKKWDVSYALVLFGAIILVRLPLYAEEAVLRQMGQDRGLCTAAEAAVDSACRLP